MRKGWVVIFCDNYVVIRSGGIAEHEDSDKLKDFNGKVQSCRQQVMSSFR